MINSALLFPILLLLGGIATRSAAKPGLAGQGGGAKPADSEAGGDKAALLSSEKPGAQKGLSKPLGVALFLAWALLLLALWAWADLPGAPRMARPSLQPGSSPACNRHAPSLQPPRTQPATATHPACNRHAPSLQPHVHRCASRAPSSAPGRLCGAADRSHSPCCTHHDYNSLWAWLTTGMAHYGHGSLWAWLTTMTGRAPHVAARARVHSVRRALAH